MAVVRYRVGGAEGLHEIGNEVVVGRGSRSDLILDDADGVSRSHARIRGSGGVYLIEDLDSRNGTRIRRGEHTLEVTVAVALEDGDVILLGAVELTFDVTSPAALTAAPLAATHVPAETRVGGSLPAAPPPPPASPPPPAPAGRRWPLVVGVALVAGVAAAAVAIVL